MAPFLIKIVSIPVFWILNALGYIISAVAIKKGYATELAKSRMITLAMLIGIIIGYITGNIVPLKNEYNKDQINLLGIKSVNTKSKLTLDKLNKAVKQESKELNINLKTLQTHKEFQAINFCNATEIGQILILYLHLGQEITIQF